VSILPQGIIAGRSVRLAAASSGRLFLAIACASSLPAAFQLAIARARYQNGDYSVALRALRDSVQQDPATLLLRGQCEYMLGDAKAASVSLEKAVVLEPANAELHLWLGRAYGRRAETSSFLLAPLLATKAHQNFEAAVRLAPGNLEAINDLFEYYLEAPAFLGGGLTKADALSSRVRILDPAEYEYDQARLAEARKRFDVAERHYRRAVELDSQDAGRLTDLAGFLAARGRYPESDQTFARASEIAPERPSVLFQTAKALVQFHRKLETARALLKRYLISRLTPEDPPRYEAEQLLEVASTGARAIR
jgi:tetratricopeptide (TPR) repeat protein